MIYNDKVSVSTLIPFVPRDQSFSDWLNENWVGGVPTECTNLVDDKDCRAQKIAKCIHCRYYSEMMDIYYFGRVLDSTKGGL